MKLKDWLDIWMSKYVKHTVKIRTYNTYLQFIEKHINPKLGDYELEQLSPKILQEFVLNKLEKGNLKTGKSLANNTVIGMINILKQAIEQANSLEITNVNFTQKIKMPLQEETKVCAFEKQEQDKLVKFCLNSKKTNYIGIVICLYTGLRIGELLALTWNDIDFVKNYMTISKSAFQCKKDNKISIIVDTPKTKNSNRIIPLPKQLVSILKAMKKNSKSQYVITTKNNGMVGTRSYQRTFETILHKLNIPYKNFHSLRHTFATRALEFGMDVKTVSEILGHKNPMITLQRYTHSLMSYKTEMMNKFGKMLYV